MEADAEPNVISKDLIYRVYGDALAVVVDMERSRVVLLEKEALQLWKKLCVTNALSETDRGHPAFTWLYDAGLLETHAPQGAMPAQPAPMFDLAVLNWWAFRNHVPIVGHFELTGRCNLRCKHCYCLFDRRSDVLDTAAVCKILDELRDCGTFGLVLTGGEVFFRKDIMEILTHLYDNRFIVRINTNGTFIDEAIVKKLVSFSNIYRIHVSLYGPDAATHDAITNSHGSFQKTLTALRLLSAAGLRVRINCSLMRSNFDVYQRIQSEIADTLGIPVHYDSIIFPRDDGSTENLLEEISPAQTVQFMNERSKQVKGQPIVDKRRKLCKAGFSFFAIAGDGKVYPCLKMKRFYRNPLGDLRTDSFQDLWNRSASIQSIRTALADKLRDCDICKMVI